MSNIKTRNNSNQGYNPRIQVVKKVNKSVMKVFDIFKYTIEVINSGNIKISNVVAIDLLPSAFKVKEIRLDGIKIEGDIQNGLEIGDFEIGKQKVITLYVEVVSDLIEEFNNVIEVMGEVVIDGEVVQVKESAIEPIGIKVYNPYLNLVKSVDKEYAVVDDILTYKIVASNSSNIDLTNVIISDLLSPELEFIEGTVTLDGIELKEELITSGVDICNLAIGQTKVITFKAKIISESLKEIVNISTASYNFNLNDNCTQCCSVNSNKVVVGVEEASIKVFKSVDKKIVSLGEILKYKVELVNNGSLDALNVMLKDNMPCALKLINGSFKVNGKIINSVNVNRGVIIGNIPIKTSVVVEYDTEVIDSVCTGNIINEAEVCFKYILPDGMIFNKRSIVDTQSMALVSINLTTFKQISVDECLAIPMQKPEMECINNITANVKIIDSHIIKTTKDKSHELQVLTGYKLIIHGVLNQVVEYTALNNEESVHAAHYNIPFSSFIILPEHFNPGSKIEVEGIVEDIYFKEHDCRTFFKNVTLLLVAKIVLCSI